MAGNRKRLGSINVSQYVDIDVDIGEILEELDDDHLRGEMERRELAMPVAFDLLAEIHFELRRGKIQAALCLIESAQNARIVPESRRQAQFQAANRATAH
jgi:hypothetical protein